MENSDSEQLRREYEALPKNIHHIVNQHRELNPEWIMQVIKEPHDQWPEVMDNGEVRLILVGRVARFHQWIKVVLTETGELLTAYADRRLERDYGGRPWQNEG